MSRQAHQALRLNPITEGIKQHLQSQRVQVLATALIASSVAFAPAESFAQSSALEEIIVTATKRAANAQDVPVPLQAISGDTLRELHIETFDKYVEFLPNVSSTGIAPGQKEVFMRGAATEHGTVVVAQFNAPGPGVQIYVDEQPVAFNGRNLDVYAVDMERIEVLAGPQGTLFGASSQSGTIRLITNKPGKEFDMGFNAKYATTKDGDDSEAVDAFINLPITDKLAVRATFYTDSAGGWIIFT